MIRFFRTIRKNLLEQNKVRTYLFYALGEIALVMIGILLALQVNNWNEERKAGIFEEEILSLIDQNLQRDSVILSKELLKAKKGVELTDRLIEQVDLKNYDDSLNYWMGKIISFERFKSQTIAFEVLQSKGIENISNKGLQLSLISYYDDDIFFVYQSLTDVEKSFNADWIPVVKEKFSDFKWEEYHQPIDPKSFLEDPSTIVLFKLYQDNREGSIPRMEAALKSISEIRSLIKLQLQ
jgi:hypothetical protein